ncbi:MAG: hypothetical protein MK209_06135 [Planctomycetes bacterium]|nr:hypothetical protein [Planctomycetota bacterium]
MSRPGPLTFLVIVALVTGGMMWWSDPARHAIEQIELSYQQKNAALHRSANAVMNNGKPSTEISPERTPVEYAQQGISPSWDKPVSHITGEVVGGKEIFLTANRSGVTVYCWPGRYAPAKVPSFSQLKGLQIATTDAEGRFAFDLSVDDAHWIYAVNESASSDPQGMRIGTKPGVQLILEMRRLVGSGYLLEGLGDPNYINAARRIKVDLPDAPKAKLFGADDFPWTFFPRTRGITKSGKPDWHGALVAWLPPTASPPLTARIRAEVPGFFPVDALFPTPRFNSSGELPCAIIPLMSLDRRD